MPNKGAPSPGIATNLVAVRSRLWGMPAKRNRSAMASPCWPVIASSSVNVADRTVRRMSLGASAGSARSVRIALIIKASRFDPVHQIRPQISRGAFPISWATWAVMNHKAPAP